MVLVIVFPILAMLTVAGCGLARKEAPATTASHRFMQPPQRAASCFARNAEEHNSALVSEVRPPDARGHVEVIVRVKNGVAYATVELRPVGTGSNGTIVLSVYSSGGNRDLIRSLVEGC